MLDHAMIPLVLCASLAAAAALPLHADTPLSGAEFDAFATGKTLYFSAGGAPYGAEEYLPDQRVRWAFEGDECITGQWYEQAGQICFTYDNGLGPQCWYFYANGTSLTAKLAGDAAGQSYQARPGSQPLFCPGPKIGV